MINPTGNKILIEDIKEEEDNKVTESGLILERNTKPKSILKAKALAIGAMVKEVRVGDIVIYEIASLSTFTFEDEECSMVTEGSILGFKRDDSVKQPIND